MKFIKGYATDTSVVLTFEVRHLLFFKRQVIFKGKEEIIRGTRFGYKWMNVTDNKIIGSSWMLDSWLLLHEEDLER